MPRSPEAMESTSLFYHGQNALIQPRLRGRISSRDDSSPNSAFAFAPLGAIFIGRHGKVFPRQFFKSLIFHYSSQLVNIVKFFLPANWAFWSLGLFFALRTAFQLSYQQLIHKWCGLALCGLPNGGSNEERSF